MDENRRIRRFSADRANDLPRRLVGAVLATVVLLTVLSLAPYPVRLDDARPAGVGAVNLLFTESGSPARYGANRVVALEAGNINFVGDCVSHPSGTGDRATPGIPDQYQPFADLYIVPAGAAPADEAALVDAAGAPNTVHGGLAGSFLYEPLGATKPGGKIKSGTYGIVVDECQNGVFDELEDSFVDDAFRVDVSQQVPGFSGELAAFQALKDRAASGASALESLDYLLKLYAIIEQAGKAAQAVNAISTQGVAVFAINQGVAAIKDASGYSALQNEAKDLARATLSQHRVRLRRLSEDPPDPNFSRFALPSAAGAHMEESTDAMGEAFAEYIAHLDALNALSGSILDGIERYQGAGDAGDAQWAIRHARTVVDAATTFESVLDDYRAASDRLVTRIDSDFTANGYATFITRVDNFLDSLPSADLRTSFRLLNTGQEPALGAFIADQHRADLAGPVLNGENDWIEAVETMEQSMVDFAASLPDVRDLVLDRQGQLATTLGDDDEDPEIEIALSGSPTAGAEVTLEVTGLSAAASVSWDLDGDGSADDASGAETAWTVPGDAIVGVPLFVSVTASGAGFTTSTSRVVTVAPGGNRPPEVEPIATTFEEVAPGSDFTYTAVATDPDGGPLTYTWLVDSFEQVGETTNSFTLDTDTTDFGGRLVEVLVSDGAALTRRSAFVSMTTTGDADNDQYLDAPGPDCVNENTPEGVTARLINPNQREIPGNAADDDCDPATPDDAGELGRVTFRNAITGYSSGSTATRSVVWSHPRKFSGDVFRLTIDWDDGSDPDTVTVAGTTVAETDFGDLTHQWVRQQLAVAMRVCVEHLDSGETFCDEASASVINNRPIVNAADLRTFGPVAHGHPRPGLPTSGDWLPLDPVGHRVISTVNPPNYVILPSSDPLPEGDGYGRVTYDQQVFGIGDDDWIGLVLGYQEGEHESPDADFVNVWWGKNLDRNINILLTCNDAPSGNVGSTNYLEAARQRGLATWSETIENQTYAHPYDPSDDAAEGEDPQLDRCSDDQGRELLAEVPVREGLIGGEGWDIRADTLGELETSLFKAESHLVDIDYQPDALTVWIDGELQFVATPPDPADPFPPGGIGLYYNSQSGIEMAVTAPERTFDFVQGKGGPLSDEDADGISIPMHDSPLDTHTIRIDWGDGTATTEGARTPDAAKGAGWYDITGRHAYEEVGTFRGSVCATDQHDSGMCFPFRAIVSNVGPIVDAGEDRPTDAAVFLDDMTFQDPGRSDTHTATVDWGDGTPVEAATVEQVQGGGIVSADHTYASSGEMTLEVCVEDQHGAEACDTRALTVTAENLAPDVLAPDGLEVPEGSDAPVPVGFTDGNVDDTHTMTIDWGDGSAPEPVAIQDGGDFGSGTAVHAYADNGTFAVVVEVCDGDGACDQRTVTATVTNVMPDVDATFTLDAGNATLDGVYSDAGIDDTHTATVDWGDGSGPVPASAVATGPGAGEVDATHTYTSTGVFTAIVCVTDDDGDEGCDGTELTVTELDGAPPEITVGDVAAITEGDTVTVEVTVDDPDDGDAHVATVDWGDGSPSTEVDVDGSTSMASADHAYRDDGTFTISVTVCDSTDRCDDEAVSAVVANAAPEVDAGRDRSSGLDVVLDDSTFSDAGLDDTHTATVDWGDGDGPGAATTTGNASAGAVQAAHTYPSFGARTVTVCVTDDDAASDCDSFVATIEPGAIDVTVASDFSVDEGTAISVPFTFTDEDGGTHTATVRWSDGSDPDDVTLDSDGESGGGTAAHTYADDGDYAASIEVCDSSGCGTGSTTVSVDNVAPVVPTPTASVEADVVEVSASFSDAGTVDTHTATVDWGDGTVDDLGAVTSPLTATHGYGGAGVHDVEVCVTDDDGGTDCAVVEVAPGRPGEHGAVRLRHRTRRVGRGNQLRPDRDLHRPRSRRVDRVGGLGRRRARRGGRRRRHRRIRDPAHLRRPRDTHDHRHRVRRSGG